MAFYRAPSPRPLLSVLAVQAAFLFAGVPAAVAAPATPPLAGAADLQRDYAIAAGPLERALTSFASVAGVDFSAASTLLSGKSSAGLRGSYTVEQGFEALLRGQGLSLVRAANGAYSVRAGAMATPVAPAASTGTAASTTLPAVTISATLDKESATGPVRGYVARRSLSGTKMDSALNENPQSVSVVTADEISDRNAESLDETLRYTVGVTPNQRPLGSDDSSLLRGFIIETTGILHDGMRNSGRTFGAAIEPYGLERLEVLRGPASVLYGQIPPGGVVNAVSKRPTLDAVRELGVEYGSYQRRQFKADVGGALDDENKLLYRMVLLGREANTRLDHDRDNRLYFAPSLSWQAGADTRLTLLARYERGNQQYAFPNQLEAPGPLGQVAPSLNLMGYDNRFKRRNLMLGYELEHRFNDTWSLRQNLRYNDMRNERTDVFPGGYGADNRSITRYFMPVDAESKSVFADTQLQARFATGALSHNVLLGMDYARIRNVDDYANRIGFVSPIDLYQPVYAHLERVPSTTPRNSRLPSRQMGLYAQDQVKWEQWVVTAGVRRDQAEMASFNTNFRNGVGTTTTGYDQSAHATTGRLGAVYLLDDGWSPYASFASSFSPEIGNGVSGSPLKPSRGKQFEAGVRYEPVGQRASYSASLFDLTRNNVTTAALGNPGLMLQSGEVTSRGLELEARAELPARLSLVAQYTYLDTEITSSNNGDRGLQQMGAPRHSASAWLRQSFTVAGSLPAFAGLGVRHLGEMRSNADDANFNVRNSGVTMWDAALGFSRGPWHFSLNINNVFDKQNLFDCGYLPGLCYRSVERTANVSAMYRF